MESGERYSQQNYLTFSEPEALLKLAQFENLELKMFVTENRKEGFHTKGYIFVKKKFIGLLSEVPI